MRPVEGISWRFGRLWDEDNILIATGTVLESGSVPAYCVLAKKMKLKREDLTMISMLSLGDHVGKEGSARHMLKMSVLKHTKSHCEDEMWS